MQVAISIFFSFYIALSSVTEPSVCKFVETKTPSEAYDFAYLFVEFRDGTDHLVQQRLGNSVMRSNLEDTVRFFTSVESYKPPGFIFTVYIKKGYERDDLVVQLDQFVALVESRGFNSVECDRVKDIEIPLFHGW